MRGRFVFPLVAIAVLPLTAACGSGGSPASGGPAATRAPAPSISAPPGSVVAGPGIVRMGRFTEIFSTPLPSSAAETKVAADFREAMVLWDLSQEKRTLVPPVGSYVTGDALAILKKTLSAFKKQDLIPAGTDILFKTTVVAVTSPTATVTSCDDGSKYTEINPDTGAVDPSFANIPRDEQYPYVTWDMTLRAGHWTLSSVSALNAPAAAAKQCLPGAQ